MNSDGSNSRNITNGNVPIGTLYDVVRWSPDSRYLLVDNFNGATLVDVANGTFTNIAAASGLSSSEVYWLPDGSGLLMTVFDRQEDAGPYLNPLHKVYVTNLDGTNPQEIFADISYGSVAIYPFSDTPIITPNSDGAGAIDPTPISEVPSITPTVADAADPNACSGAPASRVAVGNEARVLGNRPLNLRDTPNGNIVKELAEFTEFTITGGSQCANSFLWWQISLSDGTTGWLAEGNPQEYFIEPITAEANAEGLVITAPGSYQSEIGCSSDLGVGGDWAPNCNLSLLSDADGDGIYTLSLTTIPAGAYEVKIAYDNSWDMNYGANGELNGNNIPFDVPTDGATVEFSFDSVSHILTINVGGAPTTSQENTPVPTLQPTIEVVLATPVPTILSIPTQAVVSAITEESVLVFANATSYDIYVMNADGTNPINLTNSPDEEGAPAWSPDGQRIVFEAYQNGNYEIYMMNADGSNPINLTQHSSWDRVPAWSPDGQSIAFVSGRDEETGGEIYTMNIDGSNVQRVTSNSARDYCPEWSPDSTKLMYVSDMRGIEEIYIMNRDGTNRVNLTNGRAYEGCGSWYGETIVFAASSEMFGDATIYTMDSSGNNLVEVAQTTPGIIPDWSPDGQQIVFESFRDGNAEIYMVNADGTNLRRLTENTVNDDGVDWRPALSTGNLSPTPIATSAALNPTLQTPPTTVAVLPTTPATASLANPAVTDFSMACTNAGVPAPRMKLWQRGYVDTGSDESNILRQNDNGNSAEIGKIQPGTEFLVIGGPSCSGNLNRWQVLLDDGTVGWTAEGDQESGYWLVPLDIVGPSQCEGFLAPRVAVGDTAVVLAGDPNILNTNPARPSVDPLSVRLDSIPAGDTFEILNGPVCNNNIMWWRVNYQGTIGWTGEANQQGYWIEPVDGSNSSNTVPNMTLAYSDDFSSNAWDWETANEVGLFSDVENDRYSISMNASEARYWIVAPGFNDPSLAPYLNQPYQLEFDLLNPIADNNDFTLGILLDVQPNYERFKRLFVHSDGTWQLFEWVGQRNLLDEGVLTTPLDFSAQSSFHIIFQVTETSYTLLIDGQEVATMPSYGVIDGTIGFGIATNRAGFIMADFDNLEIWLYND